MNPTPDTIAARSSRGSPPLDPLRAGAHPFEEDKADDGAPRAHYADLYARLETEDLAALARGTDRELRARGVSFRTSRGARPFRVDPIPRILTATEWDLLERGVVQRVRALNAFLADVYGAREIVADGVLPARVLDGADHYEPQLRDSAAIVRAHVVGLDIVRDPSGRFLVLEDNTRSPSGLAYLAAARKSIDANFAPPAARRPLDDGFGMLERCLRAAGPDGAGGDPSIAILSDGEAGSAWYEHRCLAAALGVPIVRAAELTVAGGRVCARIDRVLRPLDVIYRRTDEDRLVDAAGRPTIFGSLLLEPCRKGAVAVVNGFGSGVADDKLVHAYVEDFVRFYLGEEPELGSIPTYDLGDEATLAAALGRLDELVIKPRWGFGGRGVVICGDAEPAVRDRAVAALRLHPERFVAQQRVLLSRHATVCGERLEPRHVDLRPFAFCVGDSIEVPPGGLTRFALEEGQLVVNSSQSGGGKDTWVLDQAIRRSSA